MQVMERDNFDFVSLLKYEGLYYPGFIALKQSVNAALFV